ncbi:MAG: peptidase domain-containing ABC transporter [Sphingomonas sp.]|nr:peptidase domain-containing ABC transporter [Sphingomonas sp.]
MHAIAPDTGILAIPMRGIRTELQNEASECGLACLAMIASAMGHRVTLAELRRRFSVSGQGINLRTLMGMADTMGLTTRPVRLELADLPELKLPAILHWKLNHFVVLEQCQRGRFLIHDPARGRRWLAREELSQAFTGIAVEFTLTPKFERKTDIERVRLGDMFHRIRGIFPSVSQMFILAAIMQMFAVVTPILNQLVIDEAITKGDLNLLSVLATGMALLLVTTTLVRLLQGFVGLYMGTQMSFQMQANLLRHTLRLPLGWFEKRRVGDVVSRFGSLQPIQDVFLNSVTAVILNVLIGVFAITLMVIYSPVLAGLEIVSVLIFLGVRVATWPYFRRRTEENLHLSAKVQTTFLETIRGARTFKLFGCEHERVAAWQNEQANVINNQIALSRFGLLGGAGTSMLAGIQQIIGWFIGARLVIEGHLTLGMLFAFQAYTAQFGGAASVLIGQFFTYRTMRIHLERLADIVHADEEPGLDLPVDPYQQLRGELTLKEVSFRYGDGEPWVIEKVNLHIKPGDFVCLRGPSGGGKTTILKLLLGFSEPGIGEILIDGQPLRRYGIRSFRSKVGVVLQDDQLFAATIADNISFFDVDSDEARIKAAAVAAQIDDEIMQLPMAYQTFTGDLGSTLSAGQRQRLLLARALYREPAVLFLDEGTANLDPESERLVMEVVRNLPITRIVVAHREGASVGASRVVYVNGRSLTEMANVNRDGAPIFQNDPHEGRPDTGDED